MWAAFHGVLDAKPDRRFVQAMLAYCAERMPAKARDVLDEAIHRGVCIADDALFCTFLKACSRTKPIAFRDALEFYKKYGPRSHNVIFGVGNVCRLAGHPQLALELIQDGIDQNVEFSEALVSLFAVICAESHCQLAADMAELLLERVRAHRIASHRNPQLYANFAKALLSQNRFDAAVRILSLLDCIGMQPSEQLGTLLLSSLAKADRADLALDVFDVMARRAIRVPAPAFGLLVSACARQSDLASVQMLLRYAQERSADLLNDTVLCRFVSAFGSRSDVHRVRLMEFYANLKGLMSKSFVLTSFVSAYGQCSLSTSVAALERVARDNDLLQQDVVVAAFIEAYGGCCDIEAAQRIFQERCSTKPTPDMATFAAAITLYARHGMPLDALTLFDRLESGNRKPPSEVYPAVLSACVTLNDPARATRVFQLIVDGDHIQIPRDVLQSFVSLCGRCSDLRALSAAHRYVAGCSSLKDDDDLTNAFVLAFDQCGRLDIAKDILLTSSSFRTLTLPTMVRIFARHQHVDEMVSSFESMVASGADASDDLRALVCRGLANADRIPMALELVRGMAHVGNAVVVDLVSACGRCVHLSDLSLLYRYANEKDWILNNAVGGAFIQAYSLCGRVDIAEQVFRDLVTYSLDAYTAMIAAYGHHGLVPEALAMLDQLVYAGLEPSAEILAGLLAACEHAGDLFRANDIVFEFNNSWGIPVGVTHTNHLLSLHGRLSGPLEAMTMATSLPGATADMWMAVLTAARTHNDIDHAESAFNRLVSMPDAATCHLCRAFEVMSDVYARNGRPDDVSRLRDGMKSRGIPDSPGRTKVSLPDGTVEFLADDARYYTDPGLRHDMTRLINDLTDNGYSPDTSVIRRATVSQEEARQAVCLHSEKLAIAYALKHSSRSGVPVCAASDLLVCTDCHDAAKFASSITGRSIYIRDTSRHHHFHNGKCSCGDHW